MAEYIGPIEPREAWDKWHVQDIGLDEPVKKLTPERIEKITNRILNGEGLARIKANVATCIHCGLCSSACHHYLSNDGNPHFAPVGKIRNTLWPMLKAKGKVNAEFIKTAAEIVYTECNVCMRCSMFCPFGIDIAHLISLVRRICHFCRVVPQYLQDTVNSHAVTMNQMWVKQDEWIDTLQWQEEDAQDVVTTARIPLDKEGADVMYSVIGPEPKILAQLLANASIIMTVAGIDWTMPSFDGWDNSDMAMYSGDWEVMGRVKKAHFEAAMRLKCKKIVMGECGHAFRSVYDRGNRILAWRMHPIPIVHAVQFYYELLRDGKIKIARKIKEPVTLHDPCNIMRGRGLYEMARYVMKAICEDFRDMWPNRQYNYCCNAGGDTINCGPPWKTKRCDSNKVKAEQLERTGAKIVVTPCHNCHSGMEDIVGYYNLGMHVNFISELLVECIEIPEAIKA